MPVTIHDVAERAGVGIGTVSSVLNNSRPVQDETRRRVLAAIAELDYVPNPTGRNLSMGKTHTIAVAIPYFTSASQIERLRGVMSALSESEYEISLFVVETKEQSQKVFKTVPRRGRADGLLVISLIPSEEDLHRISAHNIPVVFVETAHPNFACVTVDHREGGQKAVQHLIELGHRKIAYVGDYLDDRLGNFISRYRYEGYRAALDKAGISFRPEYIRQTDLTRHAAREQALALLQLPDPPTAIFAYADEMALGVLEAARSLSLRVPEDFSVVGYDDIELAHFVQLTTIRQHMFDSGVHGVNLLMKAMGVLDGVPPTTLNLSTELVCRQTTAPPPGLA